MKKTYLKPNNELLQAECVQMIAVSLIDGVKADNSEVLSKENNNWDIWEDE